jgi:alkylation response protein AidB-like acyl-CoA dehydrogenase
MDFTVDTDEEALRASIRAFLDKEGSLENVRLIAESGTGTDADGWRALASQVGLTSIGIAEDLGGAGYGFAFVAAACEELGAALYPSPYLGSHVLAASLLTELGSERALVRDLAGGNRVAALALSHLPGIWSPTKVGVLATETGSCTVTGQASFVIGALEAGVLLVVARLADEIALFMVDPAAEGVSTTPLDGIDITRRLARIDFKSAPARRVTTQGAVAEAVRAVLDRAAIALAAEQIGGAQRCLDLAVAHAKMRIQFGRPIGSFQAIKHKCADILLALEPARTAVRAAAWSVDNAPSDVPVMASLVKFRCSELFVRAARECIQIHGGMGFTWAHPAHLYFRRATSSAAMFGVPDDHREQLIRRLGVDGQGREPDLHAG